MSLVVYTVVMGNWTQHTYSAIKTASDSRPLTMKDLTHWFVLDVRSVCI